MRESLCTDLHGSLTQSIGEKSIDQCLHCAAFEKKGESVHK